MRACKREADIVGKVSEALGGSDVRAEDSGPNQMNTPTRGKIVQKLRTERRLVQHVGRSEKNRDQCDQVRLC